jgi:hypothetical protein
VVVAGYGIIPGLRAGPFEGLMQPVFCSMGFAAKVPCFHWAQECAGVFRAALQM